MGLVLVLLRVGSQIWRVQSPVKVSMLKGREVKGCTLETSILYRDQRREKGDADIRWAAGEKQKMWGHSRISLGPNVAFGHNWCLKMASGCPGCREWKNDVGCVRTWRPHLRPRINFCWSIWKICAEACLPRFVQSLLQMGGTQSIKPIYLFLCIHVFCYLYLIFPLIIVCFQYMVEVGRRESHDGSAGECADFWWFGNIFITGLYSSTTISKTFTSGGKTWISEITGIWQGLQSQNNWHPNTPNIETLRDCQVTSALRCDRQESLEYHDIQHAVRHVSRTLPSSDRTHRSFDSRCACRVYAFFIFHSKTTPSLSLSDSGYPVVPDEIHEKWPSGILYLSLASCPSSHPSPQIVAQFTLQNSDKPPRGLLATAV